MNFIGSPRLKTLLLLLRKDLKASDIPGRTTIRNRIDSMYAEHMETLKDSLKVRVFISFYFN